MLFSVFSSRFFFFFFSRSFLAFFSFLSAFLFFSFADASEQALEQGHTLVKQFRYKEAIPILKKSFENKSLTDTERAEAALLIAFCHYRLAEMKEAREAFAQALRLSPNISYPPIMKKSSMTVQTFLTVTDFV